MKVKYLINFNVRDLSEPAMVLIIFIFITLFFGFTLILVLIYVTILHLTLVIIFFLLTVLYATIYRRTKSFFIKMDYYKINPSAIEVITSNCRKFNIEFDNIRMFILPFLNTNTWNKRLSGQITFIEKDNIYNLFLIHPRTSYRILLAYLKYIKMHPNKFKSIIIALNDYADKPTPYILQKINKKSRFNPEVWDIYLEKWLSRQYKEYWLNTPLEQILKDIHCPYTLEELENPSDDELVEIDESKLVEGCIIKLS